MRGRFAEMYARGSAANSTPTRSIVRTAQRSVGFGTLVIRWGMNPATRVRSLINPKPRGFILTTVLGIVGALLASWLGQAVGWYQPGENAGFFGALIGAIIILLIWRQVARPR